jgi:hypothetical protein
MDLQKYEIKMRAKKMHLNFRNLFNGDKTLGESSAVITGVLTSPAYLHVAEFNSKT